MRWKCAARLDCGKLSSGTFTLPDYQKRVATGAGKRDKTENEIREWDIDRQNGMLARQTGCYVMPQTFALFAIAHSIIGGVN